MKFNRNLIRFFIAFIIVGMTLPFVSSIKAKADCLSADQVKELLMIATDGKEINQSWVDEILNGQTPDQLCIDEMKEALESADNAVDISNISVSGLEQTLEHFETGEDFISDVLKPVGRCVVALNAIKEARQGDIPGLVTVLSEAGLEELFSPTAPFFLAKDAGLVLSNYISKWYDNTIISNYIDHCMYCKEIGVSPWYSLYLTDTTPEEQEIIKSNLQKLADCIYEIETNTTLADSSTSQQYSVSMTPDSSWNELPGEVSFTASTSNAASSISEYKWYINNELVKDGTENNFSYNFSKIDTYQVAVKAIDSLGNETTGYGYENVNSPVHACLNCDHNADCPYGSPAHCTFNFDASLSSVENGWGSISKYNWTIKDNDGNIVVSEDSSSPKYSYTYYGDSTQKYYYAALTVYSDTGYKGTSESSIVIGSFGETDDDITTTINQDLVLSKSFSPYIYSSGVSYSTGFNSFIVDGADLTINPGVEATFEKGITVINGGSITVKDGATVNAPFIDIESGTLDVEGTESDTCTINSTVSCGKSTAKINYATIDTVSGTDSALDIQNSVIKQDVGTDNSSLKLINCALKQFSVDNATGTADIEGCHATGDSSIDAKAVNSAQQIIIKNNKFDSAVELFLQKGLLNQFDFEGNTGAGLILYGELDQQFNLDIGMPIQLGFQNNILSVIQGGDMTLKSDNISSSGLAVDGGSITFEEGSAISGPIDVSNGELKLLGTAEHPITASDIQATNSTVDIEYATISGSNTGIDGLFINGGTLQLENCDINTVFYLINITGSNAIEGNKFENSFWITQDDNNQQILMKNNTLIKEGYICNPSSHISFEGNTGIGITFYGQLDQELALKDIGMHVDLGYYLYDNTYLDNLTIASGGSLIIDSSDVTANGLKVDGGCLTAENGAKLNGTININSGNLKLLGTSGISVTDNCSIDAKNSNIDIEYANVNNKISLDGGTLQLNNNDIKGILDLKNVSGQTVIQKNTFEGAPYAFRIEPNTNSSEQEILIGENNLLQDGIIAYNDGQINRITYEGNTGAEIALIGSLDQIVELNDPVTKISLGCNNLYGYYDLNVKTGGNVKISKTADVVKTYLTLSGGNVNANQNQPAPTGLTGVAPTTSANTDGQITGVSTDMEFRLSGDSTYAPITGTTITGLIPGTYYVRYAEKDGYNASPDTEVTVASHTEQIKDQPAPTGLTGVAPTTSANTDGQITGVSTDMEFRLSGDSTYTPVTGTTITGLIPGTYYVRYAEKDGYNASPDTEVTVASHTEQIKDQPAPTGLTGVAPTTSGNTDGQITGTDWAMEYKLSADTNYTAVTGTVITGLAAGTYDVRYAAKDGYNASADVIVIVPGYTAAQPGFSGGGTTKTASDVQQETSGNTTTLTATTAGKSDALGKVTASVAASALNNMADSAADAEKQGKSSNVIISVNSSSDSASVTADMQRSAFDNIADKTNADVKVQTGLGSITFDSKAVDSISKTSSSGNVDVSIAVMDNSALSSSLQKAVGDRPVYDLSVMVGSAHVSTFGGGAINVALPYALKDGEDPRAIVVYWIDDLGKLQTVKGAYNTATGMAEFTTSHFSKYAVGYNKVMFSDVSGSAWYSGAVTFIAARGITTGTSNNCFDPDAPLTRGQFLVMLMRAYGISPDANSSNFSDAGNTYYTDYLAAAKQLGIAGGVGDNKFEPDKMITRQDMAVLLYRVLKAINELSVSANGQTVSSFSDADSVSSYALDAMNALVSGGIISGSSGKLDPLGYTSRAQMAQVLYNLLSKTF